MRAAAASASRSLAARPRRRRRGGVAIVVYNIDWAGGMERQAARLAERIAASGRRVLILSSFFPKGLGLTSSKEPRWFERRGGILIYRIPFFGWWNYAASQDLFETLGAWIIQRHAAWVDTVYSVQVQAGAHASRIVSALDRPVVLKLACSGDVGDIQHMRRKPEGPDVLARARTLDRVIYLNEESRDEALSAGIERSRLLHIPNGIDLDRFPAELEPVTLGEIGFVDGRELVVFVGRLDSQKRIHVLLEAFARIALRRSEARLVVVGAGPAREGLEQLARERQLLATRVRFTGVRTDVPRILKAASVFVLPSAQEGLSNALLEAMAAGAPAVVTDIPGNRDVARDGREALLVPVDDDVALERAIERLLVDRDLALRLARAGRERVESAYSIDEVVRRYLELFDSLPRGKPHSSARFLLRYLRSDLTPLSWILAREAVQVVLKVANKVVTKAVVESKRALGIEGDLFPRRKQKGSEQTSSFL